MTSLQHIVGGHRPEMPEVWAIQIFMHLLWMLIVTPLQSPVMLCGATHHPSFICLGVFPLKMGFYICQEATIIKFSSRSKKKKKKRKMTFYCLQYNTSSLPRGNSCMRTDNITNPKAWSLCLKILPYCGFLQIRLKTVTKRRHLDLKGSVHFLIAGVLPADVREHHLGI